MALLGEEVVEEWLNRNGYFTIRGIKVGVDEIDILAIRPTPDGQHECRHIEVQVSINPISEEIQGTLLTIFTNIFAASLNHDIIVLCHDRRDWMHPERFIM
jgi:hypothetical protein